VTEGSGGVARGRLEGGSGSDGGGENKDGRGSQDAFNGNGNSTLGAAFVDKQDA